MTLRTPTDDNGSMVQPLILRGLAAMSPGSVACVALAGTLIASLAAGGEPDPDLAFAERTLKEANMATDGPGLLAFFRTRTLSEADQERLAASVRRLGDERFTVREKASRDLSNAGRSALPFLRAALHDADPEIARRALLCLEEISHQPSSALVTAAARLVADRRPPGTVETLLAYLPCADEETSEDAVFAALARVGVNAARPEPALVAALEDKHPLRRAAAAQLVGEVAGVQRRVADKLLADPDPRVRFEAARALAQAGERNAVPTLIGLLSDGPVKLAWQVEDLLGRLAGDRVPSVALGAGEAGDRRKSREAWEGWWRLHQAGVNMTRLQGEEEPSLGLTLVCEYDGSSGGRVWEFGSDGKPRWQVTGLQGPNDAQLLPGGRVLIAERNASRITERDRLGKVLWQYKTAANPIVCQRLRTGHTLIATFSELFEVTPDHKKVFSHSHPAGFRHAARLRNGNTVYVASNGQVVELDPGWKQVRAVTPGKDGQGAGYWASVQALPAGRFLLALGGANKVIEMDGAGRILWECPLASAVHATRLKNGHTLVACFEGRVLVEVDRSGKEVGRVALPGRPFTVRRY